MTNYVPPGVEITEAVAPPTVSPIIASPSDVLLVGPSQGYQTHTEKVNLTTAGTSIKLPFLAQLNAEAANSATLVEVTEITNYSAPTGKAYKVTTDYTVNVTNGTIAIAASGSTIPNNAIVLVSYKWVPSNYFFPQRFSSIGTIASFYGSALDSTGSKINSPLTFAASLALSNGSGSIILQPLFINETDPATSTTPKLQPTSTQVQETTAWADTLELAQGYTQNVDFVVPIVGQSMEHGSDSAQEAIYKQVQQFVLRMANEQIYAFELFGDDSSGSTTQGQSTHIRSTAAALKSFAGGQLSEQTIYVNTSNFQIALPSSSASTPQANLAVGGQYVAAALAGAIAGRPVSSAMTRKAISGFTAILDQRSLPEKNKDAESGLLVMEEVGNNVRVRHGITLDSANAARSEISVVRAKLNMITSVKETLENQIIGQIIADGHSPFVVRSAISGVLAALQGEGAILDFSQVTANISQLNPTTITASFSYRPAFTLNYVKIEFALDLTAQTVTTQ